MLAYTGLYVTSPVHSLVQYQHIVHPIWSLRWSGANYSTSEQQRSKSVGSRFDLITVAHKSFPILVDWIQCRLGRANVGSGK